MTVLDGYALVALLADEPAAGEVEQLLREDDCAVPLVNLAEAIDVTRRAHGLSPEDVRTAIEPLLGESLAFLLPAERHARRAAEIRVRHYHRRTRPLSLADCFLVAAASASDRVATTDGPLAHAARAKGVPVVGLPDRSGRRP